MALPVKRSSRWLHSSILLAAALILLLLALDFSGRFLRQMRSATLFCFYRNFWMTVAPLPGRPVDLGGFYGGNLWVATEKGVYRFDGSRWTEAPEASPAGRPAALAASANGVWVLNTLGDLSHFDGQKWSHETLGGRAPSGPGAASGTRTAAAQLAAAGDGTLWMLLDGLWRLSGNVWTEVRPEDQQAIGWRLAGANSGAAWLTRGNEVEAVLPDGSVDVRFRADAPGIAGGEVYGVIASPEALWLVTEGGFAVHDGAGWRTLGAPPHSGGVLNAVSAFDGGLFAIASAPPPGPAARLVLALPALLVSAAALLLLAYLFRYWRRRRTASRESVERIGWDPRNALAMRWTRAALNSADYRGAMQNLRRLAAGIPSRHMLLLEAAVLSLGGLPEEAERSSRRALGRISGPQARFALDRLAVALADLGRFDEARQYLEDALDIEQDFDLANADLAELVLLLGGDFAEALELVERAIAAPPSPSAYLVGRQMDAETMALRAWALGGLGKRLEAEISIQRALDRADQKCGPTLAAIYWRIGMALEQIGDYNAAMTHFCNAAMVDPQGKYGNLAKLQIEQRATWGVSA
jgi:tetratricopeptide (TPR) repeat protein